MWKEDDVFLIPNRCRGIGDHLQFSRLSEYFYTDFKKKLRIKVNDKYGIFTSLRNTIITEIDEPTVNLWESKDPYLPGNPVYRQLTRFVKNKNIVPTNIKPIYAKRRISSKEGIVAMCSNGSNRQQLNWCNRIPEHVSSLIVKKLSEKFKIIQIGGTNDNRIENTEDKRGLSIKDTVALLESCDIFIGVNSGMMHLANCIHNISCAVYVECDVERPIANNDLSKYPTNEWLYDDSSFISFSKKFKNVFHFDDFLETFK